MNALHSRVLSLIPWFLVSASGQSIPYLFESDVTGTPNKLYWQTEPGVRYDLLKSDDLASWQRVSGYPAVAAGLTMEHAFTPGPKGFFKLIPIDDQAPVIEDQFPGVDA